MSSNCAIDVAKCCEEAPLFIVDDRLTCCADSSRRRLLGGLATFESVLDADQQKTVDVKEGHTELGS